MNGVIYVLTVFLVIGIRMIYEYGQIEGLLFILKPVATMVEVFLGIPFQYNEAFGFVNEEWKVVIGRACAGTTFLMMLLCMLVFSFIPRIRSKRNKLMGFLFIVVLTYLISILANASRIIASIFMLGWDISYFQRFQGFLHQSIGIIFYLVYLIITYSIFEKVLRKKKVV